MHKPALIVYFANWRLHEQPGMPCNEVCEMPWDQVQYINHAFWKIVPDEPLPQENPRTSFHIESICPESDFGHPEPSELLPGASRSHFDQYARMTARYPQVGVVLSIGGWGNCGYFSEMSYTAQGRASFVNSCVATIRQYPWLAGIDIDWEYPGMARPSDGPGARQEGCPVFGARDENDYEADRQNFTLLMADLRKGLDEAFGSGRKVLTCCSSADPDVVLPRQDWGGVARHVDTINIMTYDMSGFDQRTGHHTSVAVTRRAVRYMRDHGVPADRICIGSPYYPHIYRVDPAADPSTVGTRLPLDRATRVPIGQILKKTPYIGPLALIEKLPADNVYGLHTAYDEEAGGAYAYANKPGSPFDHMFISYENDRSLEEKMAMVRQEGLGGVIVWEISQGDARRGWPRTRKIARLL